MQWYLASLLMLLVLAGIGLLTGGLLLGWLPLRMQPAARVFLSVPLGWCIIILVSTLIGWIGPGYASSHCALATLALAAAGAWTGRAWLRSASGEFLRLAAFCVIASAPVLAPLARIGAFSLYNDTFIYDCHAQWLQQHAFMTAATIDGGHPAWGMVVYMQANHMRMGTSFLLGWTQSLFGAEWSLDVFPVVAALGLICGALGTAATLLAACPGRWPEAWLTALAVAVTVNGFGFGAAQGFLPQTWGIALCAAAFGLRGLELSTGAENARFPAWKTGVPLGVCAAAALHCYWDILPLAGPALAGSYLLPWPGTRAGAWMDVWRRARPVFYRPAAGQLRMGTRFPGNHDQHPHRRRESGDLGGVGVSRPRARLQGVGVGAQHLDHALRAGGFAGGWLPGRTRVAGGHGGGGARGTPAPLAAAGRAAADRTIPGPSAAAGMYLAGVERSALPLFPVYRGLTLAWAKAGRLAGRNRSELEPVQGDDLEQLPAGRPGRRAGRRAGDARPLLFVEVGCHCVADGLGWHGNRLEFFPGRTSRQVPARPHRKPE